MEKVFCYNCSYFLWSRNTYCYSEDCTYPLNVKVKKVSEDSYYSPAKYMDTYVLEPKVINKDNQCKWWLRKENKWNT